MTQTARWEKDRRDRWLMWGAALALGLVGALVTMQVESLKATAISESQRTRGVLEEVRDEVKELGERVTVQTVVMSEVRATLQDHEARLRALEGR